MKLLLGILRSGFATSKRSGTGAAARDQGACAFLKMFSIFLGWRQDKVNNITIIKLTA
ncbi:hypothetical protein [Anaerobacillus alkalidiazotrophicus]|uniref:hypothetical protein n=1 Tax=Anaerobacillus alkalidiazotrophicus TaxID=472963 RepID=UPI001470DEDE|nr:hypothetical protein [Anaerobacillus alkalidiazotrophicus]